MTLTPTVLTDARIYLATADLTGYSNKVELASTANEDLKTTFASNGWVERQGTDFDSTAAMDGFFDSGDLSKPDDVFWANLGGSTAPLTVCPTSGAAGVLAYLTKGHVGDYKTGGAVGKLLPWSTSVKGNSPLVRGQILHPQGTPETATGNGTGYQLGAVTASQRLYANLHVLSVAGGGTLQVFVESSADNTFAAPTTRLTFTADTALDGQSLNLLGPVTDAWWRARWTVTGGTSPSFLFAVSAGVGPK